MPRKPFLPALALFLAFFAVAPAAEAAEHFFGGGIRYFQTLDDIRLDDLGKIDAEGNSFILSYQANPAGLFKFELDLEYFDDFGGVTGEVFSPQALILVGGNLYGGVGAGLYYLSDNPLGGDTSDLFYVGRLGLQLTLLPRIHLDLNANYQTDAFDRIFDGADSDAITLGAMVRFRIR